MPEYDEKLIKKVVKEGGKKGVEVEGASDLGGIEFFCTALEVPEGDLTLLEMSMEAMNAVPEEGSEERKGGAGGVGTMIFSAGKDTLGVVYHVPESKLEKINGTEWLAAALKPINGLLYATNSPAKGKGFVPGDKEAGIFPLKLKEEAIQASIEYLKSKGLFPEDADDDDDEPCFGDDAFDQFN